MPPRPASAWEWGVLVAVGECSERDAAIAMLTAAERRTRRQDAPLADLVVNALRAEAQRALRIREAFWVEAVGLVRRGIAAKAASQEIMRAVARLARKVSGGGAPLGCGAVLAEEIKQLVEEEIAMWIAEQKGRAA